MDDVLSAVVQNFYDTPTFVLFCLILADYKTETQLATEMHTNIRFVRKRAATLLQDGLLAMWMPSSRHQQRYYVDRKKAFASVAERWAKMIALEKNRQSSTTQNKNSADMDVFCCDKCGFEAPMIDFFEIIMRNEETHCSYCTGGVMQMKENRPDVCEAGRLDQLESFAGVLKAITTKLNTESELKTSKNE